MASTESADGGWLVISVREVAARNQLAGRQATLERLVQTASVEFARTRWFDVDEVTEHLLRSVCGIFGARLIEIGWSESEGDPLTVGARWAARSEDGWSPSGVGVRGALFESMRPAGTGSEPIVSLFEDLAAVSTTAAKQFSEAGLDAAVELRMSSSRPRAVLRLGFEGGLHRWDNVNAEPVVLLGRLVLSTLRRCRAEEELHERARRDSLTGLFNRDEFYRMLEGAVSGACPGSRVGVLYCDVDGFKSTNDQHGHASGDEVLRTVASVLQRSVRDGDIVARVGGDEFAALCRGLESPMQLEAVAERLISRIAGARVSGRPVSLSVGSAMLGDDQDADALLSAADEAMYRAKRVRRKASGTDWSST